MVRFKMSFVKCPFNSLYHCGDAAFDAADGVFLKSQPFGDLAVAQAFNR